jgi:hypothetical protein
MYFTRENHRHLLKPKGSHFTPLFPFILPGISEIPQHKTNTLRHALICRQLLHPIKIGIHCFLNLRTVYIIYHLAGCGDQFAQSFDFHFIRFLQTS